MKYKTLVVAPHADDELLGCGGTLLRRVKEGSTVGWLLMTSMKVGGIWTAEQIEQREYEIRQVREGLGIKVENFFSLGFPSTQLDQIAFDEMVSRISIVFKSFEPEEILIPHGGDIHSDHRVVFNAVGACTKWFRYPSVKRILSYETLSETDCTLESNECFKPNFFIDISSYLEKKLELLSFYRSELGDFPFPRSETAIRALAQVRGAQSGFVAAEAYQLLRERS